MICSFKRYLSYLSRANNFQLILHHPKGAKPAGLLAKPIEEQELAQQ